MEAHVQAVEAVSDAADVTSVVEDLLAVAPGEQQEIVDAEVVTEADLVETVRAALAESPGLLSGSMRVEADAGVVWLRGELERPDAIIEAERRAASVPGVAEVRNLLHLPGTPPPRG
jgi:osmotically-inducible protein OsmY